MHVVSLTQHRDKYQIMSLVYRYTPIYKIKKCFKEIVFDNTLK